MYVNSYTSSMAANVYAQNNLPRYIVEKLIELGIDPIDVTSVSQANQLIAQAENAKRQEQNNNEQNQFAGASANQQVSFESNFEDDNIRKKAILLAQKLGISVSKEDTIQDIIENIQSELDKLIKEAQKNGDEAQYYNCLNLQFQLDLIKGAVQSGQAQTELTTYMDLLAYQNKFQYNIYFG